MSRKIERPKALASAAPSKGWKQRDDYKKENRDWLRRSRRVALRVLEILEERGMSNQDLANLMIVSRQHVSKIVKGQENFTFETISKLERALGIVLMDIYDSKDRIGSAEKFVVFAKQDSLAKNWNDIINNYPSSPGTYGVAEIFEDSLTYHPEHLDGLRAGESNYAMAS